MRGGRWLGGVVCTMLLACAGQGEDLEPGPGPDDFDPNSPACRACAETLTTESAACAIDPVACTADQDVETAKACFRTEGECQDAALRRASDCHRACGDVPQAEVEACAGGCFVGRAECYEIIVEVLDRCYQRCNDPASCLVCDSSFRAQAAACDDQIQTCADECVETHRPGG